MNASRIVCASLLVPFLALPLLSEEPRADDTPRSGVVVMRMVLCLDVKDREPVAPLTSATVGQTVIAWTKIRSGLGAVKVTHRWRHEGKIVSDVSLPIKGSPYRTWTRKTVHAPGRWAVQVHNSAGDLLKETVFHVAP